MLDRLEIGSSDITQAGLELILLLLCLLFQYRYEQTHQMAENTHYCEEELSWEVLLQGLSRLNVRQSGGHLKACIHS